MIQFDQDWPHFAHNKHFWDRPHFSPNGLPIQFSRSGVSNMALSALPLTSSKSN